MERRKMDSPAAEIGPVVVSPRRAQQMLGVGTTTLFKLLKTGELQSVKIGKSRRISVASIRKLAEAGTIR
jgi:excisionase family DNA binding protein